MKDIALVIRSMNKAYYPLGIDVVVDSSSLSKANESGIIGFLKPKPDYLFLCVPKAIKDEALKFIEWDDCIGLFILEAGQIVRFPASRRSLQNGKKGALFANPTLSLMWFKPLKNPF